LMTFWARKEGKGFWREKLQVFLPPSMRGTRSRRKRKRFLEDPPLPFSQGKLREPEGFFLFFSLCSFPLAPFTTKTVYLPPRTSPSARKTPPSFLKGRKEFHLSSLRNSTPPEYPKKITFSFPRRRGTLALPREGRDLSVKQIKGGEPFLSPFYFYREFARLFFIGGRPSIDFLEGRWGSPLFFIEVVSFPLRGVDPPHTKSHPIIFSPFEPF